MTSSKETEIDPESLAELERSVGAVRRGDHSGAGLRVALICGSFNGGITLRLAHGAVTALMASGVDRSDISLSWVPGAFEIPLAAQQVLAAGAADAVIALGAVIRGETGHYDFVAGECAAGIQRVQLDTGAPVIFGVLTTDTVEQALTRSEPGETNKGYEAAITAIEMVRLAQTLVPTTTTGS